jgi:hypothetical protein
MGGAAMSGCRMLIAQSRVAGCAKPSVRRLARLVARAKVRAVPLLGRCSPPVTAPVRARPTTGPIRADRAWGLPYLVATGAAAEAKREPGRG